MQVSTLIAHLREYEKMNPNLRVLIEMPDPVVNLASMTHVDCSSLQLLQLPSGEALVLSGHKPPVSEDG